MRNRKHEIRIVLTCEHGGNKVPGPLRQQFQNATETLASHRGWDPGALPLAKRFASEQRMPQLYFSDVSRLIVELNRSIGHPKLFSEFTRELPDETKASLIENYWTPHRDQVQKTIASHVNHGDIVVHLSVHTFTQFFGEEVRTTDIGLLYDPKRDLEKTVCSLWRNELQQYNPDWKIRRNDPYKGNSDGFTTYLREQFPAAQYLGLELEVCQKFFLNGGQPWKDMLAAVPRTFSQAVKDFAAMMNIASLP